MITQLTEQQGIFIAEFRDLKRFTLAITEEVKSELKPLLSKENTRLIFNLEHGHNENKNNLKNITVSELIKLGKLVNRVNENFGKENLK